VCSVTDLLLYQFQRGREKVLGQFQKKEGSGPVPAWKKEGSGSVPMNKKEGSGPVLIKKEGGAVVYKPPWFRFNELAREKMDYFLVLDFEANQNERYPDVKEIIELPILKLNVTTLAVEAEFHTYVQPSVQPNITPFITELTGITQDMVKGQPYLPEVLEKLHEWMKSEGLVGGELKSIFVTCGDWDLKSALPKNCSFLQLEYRDYLKRWINIKTCFQAVTGVKGHGMLSMLEHLGVELEGRHHSGIDDSRNIAKIMAELMTRDGELREGWVKPRKLMRSS